LGQFGLFANSADGERKALRATLILLLTTTLLHLLVGGRIALSVDEAHYALYGLMLDWSYFDHPPMVGWLQAAVLPLSREEWALRLWPALLTALGGGLLYRLTRELFAGQSPWLAFVAVLILQSAVIVQLLGIALVPEVPLLVFGLAAALSLWQAVNRGEWRDWLLLGLLLGLAGLSKYTAVTLALSVVLFILWQGRWRLLLTPRPWLAALVALLTILPVLYWNAGHDWISFRYQLGHGAPDRGWEAGRFARAQAGQLLAYAPGVYLFGLIALVCAVRRPRQPERRLLLSLALPPLLLFGWASGFEETLPHWTLLAFAFLAPLSAQWLWSHWHQRWVRVTAIGSLLYSTLLVLLIHSQFLLPWLPFKPLQHPLSDLYGWQAAAERAASLNRGRDTPLLVGNWSLASRIAWYARPQPVQVTDARVDQFDLWFGSPQRGDSGLLIVPDYYEGREQVSGLAKFERCELAEQLTVPLGETPVHRFSFYDCMGYRG
jgi:4-amino-4-deoxy-L-arabinose transferase-like glycosyltransferase